MTKQNLSRNEIVSVGIMLFGLFFGAGNLIFPVFMGQEAGREVWVASAGFLISGVGIPLLAVVALGNSHSDSLQEMAEHVGKKYSIFLTCALYLTIGPFFAIPRCASVSYSVGILPIIADEKLAGVLLWAFSFLFFAAVLWFSLRPGKILTWVGKVLTPIFLVSLAILLVAALLQPMGDFSQVEPQAAYAQGTFAKGFLEGYNTMDAIAGLAFGIVIINVIRDLGVQEPGAIARNTLRAGILGCAIMAVIYILLALTGAQSRALYPVSADGGEALHLIADHYFHTVGSVILAVTVTFACMKTAVGLITSCAEAFEKMFPGKLSYRAWTILFSTVAFFIANLGLSSIIAYAIPVLMFLYPLAITLILLALSQKLFDGDRRVYIATTVFTLPAAFLDLLNALGIRLGGFLPFFDLGLGWICPAVLGFVVGMILHVRAKAQEATK